jgi:hypothetical protein
MNTVPRSSNDPDRLHQSLVRLFSPEIVRHSVMRFCSGNEFLPSWQQWSGESTARFDRLASYVHSLCSSLPFFRSIHPVLLHFFRGDASDHRRLLYTTIFLAFCRAITEASPAEEVAAPGPERAAPLQAKKSQSRTVDGLRRRERSATTPG